MIYIFLSLTGLGDPWEWRITSSWFWGQQLEIPVHIDSPEFHNIYYKTLNRERKIILEVCEELPLGFDHYPLLIYFIKFLFISKLWQTQTAY